MQKSDSFTGWFLTPEVLTVIIHRNIYCESVLGTAALFDANGNLTDVGNTYKNAGGSSITPVPTPATVPTTTPDPPGEIGDVNSDGLINIVDALLVAQYYVGLNPADFTAANADTNYDSSVNIVDALLIAQYYVGLITQFC